MSAARHKLALVPSACLALAALLFFGVRVWHGVWFVPFVDESEHLLGGKMLDSGAILYRTYVDQHGPVIFMLTQFYGALFGWADPNGARSISVVLALATALCVMKTSALPDRNARLWALAVFLGSLAGVWLIQALYLVSYHPVAGFLVVCGMALFVAPAWRGQRAGRLHGFMAGTCFALVLGTHYYFGPAILCLGMSALWAAARQDRAACAAFVAGGVAGIVGIFIWLLVFGDLLGYLAFHIAENQFVSAPLMHLKTTLFFHSLVPSLRPRARVHMLALFCWAMSFGTYLCLVLVGPVPARRMAGPVVLGFGGILLLDARGSVTFQDGAFLVASLGAVGMALPAAQLRFLPRLSGLKTLAVTVLMGSFIVAVEFLGRHALSSPVPMTRAQILAASRFDIGISPDPMFARIRAVVRPDEPILAVPYAPDIYLQAGRTAMNGYYDYLPWDAAYGREPWFGQTHDICADLPKAPPPLIYFDNWNVGDKWDMHDYAPCFFVFLKAHYRQDPEFPDLYVRLDRGS
jgi:hypothetical protein